jgi:hypothetical protein
MYNINGSANMALLISPTSLRIFIREEAFSGKA